MADNQRQEGGAYSQLIQANTVIIGIDEKRAREIFDEKLTLVLKGFTIEATEIAIERSKKFNKSLIQRMVQEEALSAFSDPSFQILLIEAQKRAASTERDLDYNLLSELMVHRFKKGSNRMVRAGISRAVEVIDQISDDALLGLTVFHSLTYFIPNVGDMKVGLKVLDDLFSEIIYADLPINNDWLDHLDILDAIRRTSISRMKPLEDYWWDRFDGYLKNGIEKDSEKHKEAKEILQKANVEVDCLVQNIFDSKYVKLPISEKNLISTLHMIDNPIPRRPITEDEKLALERVYDLYDGKKMPKQDFIKELDKYPNIKKLRVWWSKINNQSIHITSVGKVLAHSNAQRVNKTLPPLN